MCVHPLYLWPPPPPPAFSPPSHVCKCSAKTTAETYDGWLWTAGPLQYLPSGLTTAHMDLPRLRWGNELLPRQRWRWSARSRYTHGPRTHARQTSTRSGDTGGGFSYHPAVHVNEGGKEWPGWEHISEFCRVWKNQPRRPWQSRLSQSLPSKLPLLFHVRAFYMVRYTSSTTHPSQTTYTCNGLHKKKKEEMRRGKKGEEKEIKSNHYTHWCCFYHFVRNSSVAWLKGLRASGM